jgi:hypothetical protein
VTAARHHDPHNLDAVIVGLDPSGRPLAASRRALPAASDPSSQSMRSCGEGATLRMAPERADRVGLIRVASARKWVSLPIVWAFGPCEPGPLTRAISASGY